MPSLDLELQYGFPAKIVAGVDEVGRGCLAGPVVTCAVVLNPGVLTLEPTWFKEVKDSKLISPEKRERISKELRSWVHAWGIGLATVEEIDQYNIHNAVFIAMERAVKSLGVTVDHVLIDGKHKPKNWSLPTSAHIKGDSKSYSIAASSIIAKVFRDQLMVEMDSKYPGYGFAKHKGYVTELHVTSIPKLGILPVHRRSFDPVKTWLGEKVML